MQGSREGTAPSISPNTGILRTVGMLGVAGPIARASFDIADVTNTAYAALSATRDGEPGWYEIDLVSGRARLIGTLRAGEAISGIAIEP